MKTLQISAIVGAVLLVGTMLVTQNVFTTRVEAEDVPVTSVFCAPGDVQHWDKIKFRIRGTYIITTTQTGSDLSFSALVNDPNKQWDIKVRDDPTKVADIEAKVRNFLANGPMIDTGGGDPNVQSTLELTDRAKIIVDDIEYEIVCTPSVSIGPGAG